MSKWIIRPASPEQQEWYQINQEFDTEDEAWEWFEEEADAIWDDGIHEVEVVQINKEE